MQDARCMQHSFMHTHYSAYKNAYLNYMATYVTCICEQNFWVFKKELDRFYLCCS